MLGPLSDFVPAAGLRWLVTGSPSHFAREPAFAPLRQRWLTDQRLQAFANATGIDLARTERALVAGFDLGTLYLVDSSGWTQKPEQPFIERLAGSARVQRPHPQVWRVTGLVGSTPEALVRLDDALIAVSVQDPLLARLVEYRARGKLDTAKVVPALQGAALSGLPAELLAPGPLRAYAPGPFSAEELPVGAGWLVAASAIALSVDLEGATLRLRCAIAGSWDSERDRPQLLGSWQGLVESELGKALGLDAAQTAPQLNVSEQVLSLDAELPAEPVLAALEQLAEGRLAPLLAPKAGAQSPESPR